MSVNKIAITTTSFAKFDSKPIDLLKEKGFEIITNPYKREIKGNEIIEICKGCIGIVAGTEKYEREILNQLTGLKVISRCGVGMDNVDIVTANGLGITVVNTPFGPTLAVSELTVGLILNLLRKINQMDRDIRAGKWEKLMGNLLNKKKVGIIGFGRIGQKTAELLNVFGVEIGYYDIEDKKTTAKKMELNALLGWADIIVLHLSASKGKVLIGKEEIDMLKSGSIFINVSRGGVASEQPLFEALKNGKIGGAALDVYEKEPYIGRFTELDNVILTPHIGSYAKEARIEMETQSVLNLLERL
ncbi:MAG: phosphoglycerate dehydrogenase [Nitrospirae bacterium]|nr:phosphoglycerate dehydrogenase [Nitrospirota bacterium]MBF0540430.1 phosphoglycerate dehydrogenase [Nitrospirota bacterium]